MNEIIKCKCGEVIGEQVSIGNEYFLRINNIVVRVLHGVCGKCGSGIHWTVSDILLERIIENHRILSNNT